MIKKKVLEATLEDEKELVSVVKNKADIVYVRNRKYKVRWIHPSVGDWISALMTKEGNDSKILSQASALIVLNGFFKCHLFYWIVWRWFYYIRQYTSSELSPLMEMAQKKTAQEVAPAYLNAMMLLTALTTTKKQMTKEEAKRFLRELRSGKDGKSVKSTESAQTP